MRLRITRLSYRKPAAPLFLATLDGSLAARDATTGDFTLTSSGPVRYRTGAASGRTAALIEEATTNRCANPLFNSATTNWSAANGSLARDATVSLMGPASGKLTATAANAEASFTATLTVATWVISFWVTNNNGGSRTAQLRYAGSDVGSPVVVAAGAMVRLIASFTGIASSQSHAVRWTDSVNGDTYQILHGQVEQKTLAFATSACPEVASDGTIQSGYTWAGTAHNSNSTRAVTLINCDEPGRISPIRGAATAWFYSEPDFGAANNTCYVWSAGTDNSAGKDILSLRTSMVGQTTLSLRTRAGTAGALSQTFESGLSAGAWFLSYAEWDGRRIAGCVGAGRIAQGLRDAPLGDIDGVGLNLGYFANNASHRDGRLGPIAIFDRPLTPSQRRRLFRSPQWTWDFVSARRAH